MRQRGAGGSDVSSCQTPFLLLPLLDHLDLLLHLRLEEVRLFFPEEMLSQFLDLCLHILYIESKKVSNI